LKEIKADYDARVQQVQAPFSSGRVMLIVKDERMLTQIKDYLSFFRPWIPSATETEGKTEDSDSPPLPPREGILHSRLRQFVTQQATFIRQSIGQSHQSSQRRNGKPQQQQKGGRIAGRERCGIVDPLLDEVRDASSCVGVASKPLTVRDFNQLHLDQKMMLALEKRLQTNAVQIGFLGLPPAPAPPTEGLKPKRAAPDSSEPSESVKSSSKRQRRETAAAPPASADTEFQCSLLDPQFHIALATHSMCHHSSTLLTDHSPSYVIMLDADIKTIRMIETYQAALDTEPVRVSEPPSSSPSPLTQSFCRFTS
jgi:hypothetical protein